MPGTGAHRGWKQTLEVDRLLWLARQGRLQDEDDLLARDDWVQALAPRDWRKILGFIDQSENGVWWEAHRTAGLGNGLPRHWANAFAIHTAVRGLQDPPRPTGTQLDRILAPLQMSYQGVPAPAPNAPPHSLARDVIHLRHLFLYSRAQAETWLESERDVYHDDGWLRHRSIRTALALKDFTLAEELLQRKGAMGPDPHDALFMARVHYHRGELESARRQFAEYVKFCRLHGATGRMDVELRLAWDLLPSDIVNLSSHSQLSDDSLHEKQSLSPRRSAPPVPPSSRLVGSSPAMRRVRDVIERVAQSDANVLVLGETGTGKELTARQIHDRSPRRQQPFVAVNCTAIPVSLLESELFGHQKGAFTGASAERMGLIAEAAEGTLFLDELGDTPLPFQSALLRLLDSGEYRPVGGTGLMYMRCRIVTATNRDLEEAVAKGDFRADLLYRLQQLSVLLPPLRDRLVDIPELVRHIIESGGNERHQVFSADLLYYLSTLPWYGNVRQLRAEVERCLVFYPDHKSIDKDEWLRVSPERQVQPSRQVAGQAVNPVRWSPDIRANILMFFQEHAQATRKQCTEALGISPATATKYLNALTNEGLLDKVEPNRAPRSHFWELRGGTSA